MQHLFLALRQLSNALLLFTFVTKFIKDAYKSLMKYAYSYKR